MPTRGSFCSVHFAIRARSLRWVMVSRELCARSRKRWLRAAKAKGPWKLAPKLPQTRVQEASAPQRSDDNVTESSSDCLGESVSDLES